MINKKLTKTHLNLIKNSIVGNLIKIWYSILPIPSLLRGKSTGKFQNDLIVSLTSYGRRVNQTVYYTLLSLLHQSLIPSKIILWLDNDHWDSENLPNKLKKLQKKGIEIKFCEDLKSYKKLIPTLKDYPNSVIITVDDDVVYSRDLIKRLFDGYQKYPDSIQCTRASILKFHNGKPIPYAQWERADSNHLSKEESLFPVGIGGVLYPPKSLHSDVLNITKFQVLCPEADDIWFWYMAKLKGTGHRYIDLVPSHYSFDAIYQALHHGSALTHSNVGSNKNDLQLEALLNAYNNL